MKNIMMKNVPRWHARDDETRTRNFYGQSEADTRLLFLFIFCFPSQGKYRLLESGVDFVHYLPDSAYFEYILFNKHNKMPQMKKLSASPSNILPKMDLKVNQSLNCGNDSLYPPSYLTFLIEEEKSLTSDQESDVSDSVQNRPRKRQRLDHLSQEEKIMRRKLKNRVAAQTARDRKKARMQELEEQVSRLAAEKKALLLKTVEHMKRIQTLEQENSELKLRLGLETTNTLKVKVESLTSTESEHSSSVSGDSRSLGQASLINGTQQKGQDLQILSLWMMQFVYLPVIARLMTFLICYSSVGKILWNLTSMTQTPTVVKSDNKCCTLRKWWGPHQKAWNPTKN